MGSLNVLFLRLEERGQFESGAREEDDGDIMDGWAISGRRPNGECCNGGLTWE